MKVLMTADTVGGVWRYAIDLASSLSARGTTVALCTMGAPLSASQKGEADAVRGLSVHESTWRLEWMDDPWDDVARAGKWLLEVARRTRPDVVHLNGYAHAALPWRAPALVVAHSCVASWWRAVHGEAAPPQFDRYRAEVRRGLDAATVVVAPTRAMLHALADAHGPSPGHVIPNGVKTALYAPTAKTQIVFAAGRLWDAAKNISALTAIANELPWPVVVAGPRERPGDRRTAPGAQSVSSLGALDQTEIARWLSRAAIYALPAYYEPFGLSVLEAALSACALVLGDIPSLHENWDGAALFVDGRDRGALARAIARLTEDAPLRARLASAARARGMSFTRERMGAAYQALYRELAPAREVHA
jgi:glycosyltransferase involved in cell wall biosynthesis